MLNFAMGSFNFQEGGKMEFIPNWQRHGMKSKEEAFVRILQTLVENAKELNKKSFTNEAVFHLGGRVITIKGTKREERHKNKGLGNSESEA